MTSQQNSKYLVDAAESNVALLRRPLTVIAIPLHHTGPVRRLPVARNFASNSLTPCQYPSYPVAIIEQTTDHRLSEPEAVVLSLRGSEGH